MSTPQQYAIVDIETTGGYASGNGITEIAILIYDGSIVTERYQKLINPQQAIPFSIQMLTGINDELVKDCPTFEEVAGEIYSMLKGRIFVAHNVNFDYSFVKHHLEVAGYQLFVQKLCTVRLSRKIKPGLASYSLGRLCDVLQIPLSNRHRAAGDAEATAILFSRLMGWDTENHIQAMLKKVSKEQQLPPNLPKKDVDTLPTCPGVYYFRDKEGKVIYVGKAINIKKRVFSHFTGHTPQQQRQVFLRTIYSITYETCGTELMALLLEATEIKRLWPTYNRALKRFEPKFGLYSYEDQNGYLRLAIGKISKYHSCIQVFNTAIEAANQLNKLIIEFNLRRELCTFAQYRPLEKPLVVQVHTQSSIREMPVKEYNELVHDAVNSLKCGLSSFIIKDKGRNDDERSCIWVEKGNLYGMGYIDNVSDLQTGEDIKESLTPYNSNHYMMQLIYSYAAKYPGKVLYME